MRLTSQVLASQGPKIGFFGFSGIWGKSVNLINKSHTNYTHKSQSKKFEKVLAFARGTTIILIPGDTPDEQCVGRVTDWQGSV